jgi:hypothetical protein
VNANATHVGDLIDDELRTTLLACAGADGGSGGCVDPGKS